MKTINEYLTEVKQGTYVGVHFSSQTIADIKSYIDANEITNPIDSEKLHTTLIYSRKQLPNFVEQGDIDPPIIGKFEKFEVWDTQDKKRALVMKYNAPELAARNKEITKEHGATSDYPEYKIHLTLSYDIGTMDVWSLKNYTGVIEIVHEYQEPLDLDWTK